MRPHHLWLPALLLATLAAAQQPAPGRIQSPTRQVKQFSELEDQLFSNIVRGNAAGLSPLLAEDFAFRTARSGGATIGRAEYLQQRLNDHSLRSFRVRRMDVRQFRDVAIVNFLYYQEATSGGKDLSGDFFITDVWQKTDAGWKLSARYSAGPGVSVGGATANQPTGKE